MKYFEKLIFTVLFLLYLTACEKDKNQPSDYRIIKSESKIYSSVDIHYVGTTSYSDDHITNSIVDMLTNSTVETKFRNTYEYIGDSVINRSYISENGNLNFKYKSVYHISNNLITVINNYRYPDSMALTAFSLLKYENNKLIENISYSPIGVINSFSKYQYDGENLSLASYSFRVHENEDPIEYVRREFTYLENRIKEELVYKDFNGYPIQLAYKKTYSYENQLLIKIDNYEFNDGTFTQYQEENYSYDEARNISSIIINNPSGSLFSDTYLNYEPGTYKYQLIYEVVSGYERPYPIN